MRLNKKLILIWLFFLVAGCGGGGGGSAVLPVTLVSIAVTPANPSIVLGSSEQCIATGTFSDNTTKNLASSVIWSSSNPSVATISATGLANSVAAGTTTISATSGNTSGSTILTVTGGASGANNVLAITVNGSLCSSGSYPNKPCVSVTICAPGTATCQTVNDILLDTGSYGLRIFKQALSISLPQVIAGSGSLAECVQFGDGSSEWGPVQTGSVILANEPAVQVSVHVIDAAFGTPTNCGTPDQSPAAAGYNGILGVGLFAQDCGSGCSSSAANGMYFSCSGSSCSGTAVALASQVQNPVALLPQDNNGVLVQLPAVAPGGAPSVNGSLVLGIGTQHNNVPSAVTTYPANQAGEFITVFNNTTFSNSFIDSGSNGLFINAPASLLPVCPAPNTGFFCPALFTSLSATNMGAFGSPSGVVGFQIGNANSLFNSGNNVFNDLGGSSAGGFDWGAPFFFGRNVFVGISGRGSSLGTGPYWAY